MPRAGWCRECGDWVWVDEEGACVNGHPAESVSSLYEAEPSPEDAPGEDADDGSAASDSGAPVAGSHGFGVGDMPAALKRFNWGALLLPSIWGIVYGVWPVVSLWLLSLIAPYAIIALVAIGGQEAVLSAATGITVVSQIVGAAISLYIGANATAMLWRKEQIRLELLPGAVPRFSIDQYLARQKKWIIAGVVVTLLSVTGLAIIGLGGGAAADQVRTELGVTRIDAASAFVWLVAEVGLGFWMAAQMRKEPS